MQAHEKRAIREGLQTDIQIMEQKKPSDNEDDPQDVSAIGHAKDTIGDFILKTSDDYQVPANKRVDVDCKR